jgi:hypothetical protein
VVGLQRHNSVERRVVKFRSGASCGTRSNRHAARRSREVRPASR